VGVARIVARNIVAHVVREDDVAAIGTRIVAAVSSVDVCIQIWGAPGSIVAAASRIVIRADPLEVAAAKVTMNMFFLDK